LKKLILFSLILLSGFVLHACSNETTSENNEYNEYNNEQISEREAISFTSDSHGNFTVIESFWGFEGDRSNILPIESATELVVQYIYDVLGETLNGKYLEMVFNYNPHISERAWNAGVYASSVGLGGDEGTGEGMIIVRIEAETGDRLTIADMRVPFFGDEIAAIFDEFEEDISIENFIEEMSILFPIPTEDEIEEAHELAQTYFTRHFGQDNVGDIHFGRFGEDLTLDYYEGSTALAFYIVDEDNVIQLAIKRKPLVFLSIDVHSVDFLNQ